MSISKKYLKTKPMSKVTFRLPPEVGEGVREAFIVGEFNGWDPRATAMQKLKSGEFKVTLDLEVGREYQYRYLLDGRVWTNDDGADRYVPAGVPGEENSVVVV
ncbi:MAG: isoamylase early set domain-containing protein [Candidatus Krumholzibacteriia bacterium]